MKNFLSFQSTSVKVHQETPSYTYMYVSKYHTKKEGAREEVSIETP